VTEKLTPEVPGVVSRLAEVELDSRPGIDLDDRLRDVPGFSLFRRSSSLASHPTTQGVSLRGIGASGASRTLVLMDGLPANDPFGSWVYWTRFNPDTLDVVELSRGASTSVFGDRAMGGVISVLTPAPQRRYFTTSAEGGNRGIVDLRGGYSDLWGPVGASAFVRGFTTEGYYVIPSATRGSIDTQAGADYVVGDLKLDYFGNGQRLSFKSNVLTEQRDNGTVVQKNSSSLGTVGAQYTRDDLAVNLYHSRGEFRSAFSTPLAGRNSERPTFNQRVPSMDTGGSLVWGRRMTAWNVFLGADVHRPSGESIDTFFPTGRTVGGGHLWQNGIFAQTDFALGSRVRLHGGLRHDFTGRGNDFWSPSFGLAISDGPRRWRASAYRSFRAPTLNELFRNFALGNNLTLANDQLRPESLVGGEAGMDWQARGIQLRTSLFYNTIEDLVGNVTVSTTPTLVTRRRANLNSATTKGAELELQKVFRHIRLQGSYLFVDAQVTSIDLRIAQVPKHQGSAQLLYYAGRTMASLGIRSFAYQYEDDLNSRGLILPGFATLQFLVRQRLVHGFSAMLAVENLLDRQYYSGRSAATPTLGAPRLWRAGLRWESGT
jgi:outer membrane receptor protein involved in Fe transport